MSGRVFLVGAGPGDPELLTVKASRLLRSAHAVLHDDLVPGEILQLIPPTVMTKNVGKRCGQKFMRQEEINFLMVTLAAAGMLVVRLKSGDPSIFGRCGEEIDALRAAGIDYEIVPAVTSALGAAASMEIPLTDRRASSAVAFITVHQAEKQEGDWTALARSGATLVLYMPGQEYGRIARRLVKAGLSADIPCAIVSRASTPQEQAYITTVGALHVAPILPAPALLIVGEVVRYGRERAPLTHDIWHRIGADTPAEQPDVMPSEF